MKVFALMCAAAIAVSTPMVNAADISCEKSCASSTAINVANGATQKFLPPACPVTAEKAYVTGFEFKGASGDTFTVATVAADGSSTITEDSACKLTTAGASFASTEANCGKGSGKGAQFALTCTKTEGCTVGYTITYACPSPEVVCPAVPSTPACTATGLTIDNTKTATFKAACANESEFAYLSAIALTGASTDKLTYVVNYKNGTAVTGCGNPTPGAALADGATAALTCGKGESADVTVDVTCGAESTGDCKVGGTVTFACAAPPPAAVTPAPSTGSMLTKANAIVGVISGMVGAFVYFNRG
jgi:hypothetical protein